MGLNTIVSSETCRASVPRSSHPYNGWSTFRTGASGSTAVTVNNISGDVRKKSVHSGVVAGTWPACEQVSPRPGPARRPEAAALAWPGHTLPSGGWSRAELGWTESSRGRAEGPEPSRAAASRAEGTPLAGHGRRAGALAGKRWLDRYGARR